MDSIILQGFMRNRDDDRYIEAGKRHDENGRRNKYNNYRDGRDNLEIKQKQSDNEHHKYPWDIRRPMKSNSKWYGKSSIPSSMNASQQIG